MKKITVLLVFLSFLVFPVFVSAQTTTVRTKVGSPSANDTLEAAQDIKGAYDKCSKGLTVDVAGLGECLKADLLSRGYSSIVVSRFDIRRRNSLAIQPPYNPCTQCLGFVALALTLLSGATDTLMQGSAADVYSLSSFTAGSLAYKKIGAGAPILPGDIGVHNTGSFGHIVIVNQPIGNVKFTALEANGNLDCRVTDSRQINRDPYVFFRKL